MTGEALPLAGCLVVALEQAVAAPMATRHLADLGARVIKLERPDGGDFARGYDTAVHGLASHFVWLNRGKESVCVDLKTERGQQIVHTLLDAADVFVQNCAPGVVERLGLDAATLRATRPGLIVANISGYGTSGPKREHKAYDMLVQAEAGMIAVTGTAEHRAKTGVPNADIAAGLYTALSITSALLRRERTGAGATVDVSMFDAAVEWMGHALYMQMYAGVEVPRMGLGHASIAPYGGFPTASGEVLIGVQNERGWRALMSEVLGAPGYVDDPRFRTNPDRVAHRADCEAVVAGLTRQWTTEALIERLNAAGVPAARINTVTDVVAHPQLAARDRWRTVGTESGPVEALLPPMTFADVELVMGDIPALGRDTDAVLAEFGVAAPHPTHTEGAGQ
ncbi:CaiB/BaiF CoA transferase family protein [Nocardia sp. alder85J]|uniref:CaiB/BaiF CoA transferase family protein n=1 Tax=Nocardia sp. alder85J TaxID=2862949 RepID=UPI001CD23197|nr:CaiB/BaiF CoA-transferase family protein [Nocardia sp. alder85J]MCX4096764.1 CaiB/BaiF CoA-transferase family protein [Nocardia sp. alder85J]